MRVAVIQQATVDDCDPDAFVASGDEDAPNHVADGKPAKRFRVPLPRVTQPCPRDLVDAPAAQMAKSTNHTAHNQSYKNHRNGIKKPMTLGKGQRRPIKGVSPAPGKKSPSFP